MGGGRGGRGRRKSRLVLLARYRYATFRSSARNVPSGKERGETDVFAGYHYALIKLSKKKRKQKPSQSVNSLGVDVIFDVFDWRCI